MNVRELQDVLRKLEAVYVSGGAKKQAGSVAALAKAIDGTPEMSIEQLIDEIRLKLSINVSIEGSRSQIIDEGLVDAFAKRLAAVGTDRRSFDILFAELKGSPVVRAAECSAIANRYRNDPTGGTYVFKFSSKLEAQEFIFDTFIGRAQAESKAGIIDRMTKWAAR